MLKPPRNVGAVQNAGLHDVAAIAVDQVFAGRLVPTLGNRGILAGFVLGLVVGQTIAVCAALVLAPQMEPPRLKHICKSRFRYSGRSIGLFCGGRGLFLLFQPHCSCASIRIQTKALPHTINDDRELAAV
jgi:hypothetical protein